MRVQCQFRCRAQKIAAERHSRSGLPCATAKDNFTFFGEFNGITQQIEQDLPHPAIVSHNIIQGTSDSSFKRQFQSLLVGAERDRLHGFSD